MLKGGKSLMTELRRMLIYLAQLEVVTSRVKVAQKTMLLRGVATRAERTIRTCSNSMAASLLAGTTPPAAVIS